MISLRVLSLFCNFTSISCGTSNFYTLYLSSLAEKMHAISIITTIVNNHGSNQLKEKELPFWKNAVLFALFRRTIKHCEDSVLTVNPWTKQNEMRFVGLCNGTDLLVIIASTMNSLQFDRQLLPTMVANCLIAIFRMKIISEFIKFHLLIQFIWQNKHNHANFLIFI